MRKIKKGDSVVVLTGRDKGKRGDVSRVVDDRHVIVNGVNQVKKHAKPNPLKNQPGGIVSKEMPIDASNVLVVCSGCDKAVRLGVKVLADGGRVRSCKKCGADNGKIRAAKAVK